MLSDLRLNIAKSVAKFDRSRVESLNLRMACDVSSNICSELSGTVYVNSALVRASIGKLNLDLNLYDSPAREQAIESNIEHVELAFSEITFSDNLLDIFVDTLPIDVACFLVNVSGNLFVALKRRSCDGKNYQDKQNLTEDLFSRKPEMPPQPQINGIRKSYSVNRTARSTTVRKLTVWDLLYPILLPPINVDFSEQVDLYRPLYGFQQKGIEFLMVNQSALLADEMGTGKTVQTVLALRFLFRQAKIRFVLILCPPAIIGSAQLSMKTGKSEGWDGHFFHWAPELNVTVVRGNQDQRRMDWTNPAHVYISTYDSFRNDIENNILTATELSKFECVVIDEAQNIKNRDSGKAKSLRKVNPNIRWALTGTPIENKIDDVINIFNFVKPKLFAGHDYSATTVKNKIRPFFLRRLKREVLTDLPEKIRQEEWLELDSDQRVEYDRILLEGKRKLSDELETAKDFELKRHIFQLLTDLKQVCNFASEKDGSPKTDLLLERIETIQENEEKVIVFSQYDKYGLGRIRQLFDKKNIKYVLYKGGLSDSERNRIVNDFRTNKEIAVFLGAVRAAGVGMTLTEASYVIHFDHWWNPAVMWQAEDRAHRPGQKVNLNVYSFWMKDTIEENIKEKLRQKGLLIENVIDSLKEDVIADIITTDEWLDMLGVKRTRQEEKRSAPNIENVLQSLKASSPYDFEEKARQFIVKLGYENARVTQRSRDGGIDVFGSRTIDAQEETIVVQCKRTDSVGVNVARELLGVITDNSKISKGFIITTGQFSEDCIRFVTSNSKLNLINGIEFSNYLIQFGLHE